MSSAPNPARARRSRLLIVGDLPELTHALSHAALPAGPPIFVRNMFQAMGELTVAPAASPITTIIIAEDAAQPSAGFKPIEALQKIDPSARVIVVSKRLDQDSVADQPQLPGVDRVIASPVQPADLHRLFTEDGFADVSLAEVAAWMAALPSPTTRRSEPPPEPARTTTSASVPDSSSSSSVKMPAPMPNPAPTIPPEHSSVAPVQNAESPAPEANAAMLGDTDLVEAILFSPQDVRDTALQLIAQQTHWDDVALIDPDKVAANRERAAARALVAFANHNFGTLESSLATAEELQPWADWLARWLMLDLTHQEHRQRSLQDDLTGAGNRRYFDAFLRDSIAQAAAARRPVTLMIFDIDNFKTYNDQFGHEAGDEILRETVRLMQTVIRQGDRVCRVGGDEFAVIFADVEAPRSPGSRHPETIEHIAKRFQDQICKMKFPKLGSEAPGTLTISAGLAAYPWDGADPNALLRKADQLALESKRKGKNIITFGKGAQRACGPESE